MTQAEIDSKTKPIIAGLLVNFLLSWTLLPLALPPFRLYSFRELMDALLWQGIGTIGWPFAILGGIANFILQAQASDLAAFLLVLVYPTMLLLLILVFISERARRWALIALHILIAFSFGAVWYQVLNGYHFMAG